MPFPMFTVSSNSNASQSTVTKYPHFQTYRCGTIPMMFDLILAIFKFERKN
jgi:uncharacterized protein YqhQ